MADSRMGKQTHNERLGEEPMNDFNDKVVMMTGATGNLGLATLRAFFPKGAKLALLALDADRIPEMYPDLLESASQSLCLSVDLTSEDEVNNAVQHTISVFDHIDILINIAGGYKGGFAIHETSNKDLDFLLNLNVRTTFNTSKAVIKHMLNRESGSIINIAARAGLSGAAKMGAYSASKSAVIRLTESMSAELKHSGIRVNCILPGTIDTPKNREDMPQADFSRWVQPEAIADVILFLASDQARGITGAAIPVYGRS
jgi:NAD(P)-dependent dehydrogenase (short-subunit alcohol dehydrogenase family)